MNVSFVHSFLEEKVIETKIEMRCWHIDHRVYKTNGLGDKYYMRH